MSDRRNVRPSQDYYEAANEWVTADAAARLLEESKTTVQAQMQVSKGDMPVARAEQLVKASPEWAAFIHRLVQARTEANRARVKMEWMKMRFMEANSDAANERTETRLRA